MATLTTLTERSELYLFQVELGAGECAERSFYVTANAGRWLSETLPELETMIAEGRMNPLQQADYFLHKFVRGDKLICRDGRDLKELYPTRHEVWELKTSDIRFFGWFYTPHIFICYQVEYKNRLEEMRVININLYDIYRNATRDFRDNLDLNEPKVAQRSDVTNDICA